MSDTEHHDVTKAEREAMAVAINKMSYHNAPRGGGEEGVLSLRNRFGYPKGPVCMQSTAPSFHYFVHFSVFFGIALCIIL